MKKLFILLLFIPFLNVKAEVRDNYIENINVAVNDENVSKLNDNNYNTYLKMDAKDLIKISSDQEFNYIYIIYYIESKEGVINYNDTNIDIGKNGFLHECIKLDAKVNEVDLTYEENVAIKEIFLFNDTLPNWVQTWELPHEKADILLFSTHSDDEHLFFAGLIPTMIANGKKIQIVYLTNHNDNPKRLDEQLNGLWAVGVRNYPVLGIFPDAYSTSLDGAINNLSYQGYTLNEVINFEADIIKRFKPDIVVNHDEAGEYGHGQHILNTHSLKEALNTLSEEEKPYKVYLHLYKENPIIMNYDIPLEYYNGMTAYEISKLGYAEHVSQHYTWFTDWLLGKNNEYSLATQIKTYSPLEYGLYYSKVGYENKDGDMFYNIPKEVVNEPIIENDNEDVDINNEENNETKKRENNYIYYIIGSASIILIVLLIIVIIQKKKH